MQSEEIDKLVGALLKAQKEIEHPKKNKKNPHFKNTYADLTAVIDAVIPVFNKHGLVVTQTVDSTLDYNLESETPCLTTQITHTSGQWLSGSSAIPVDKKGPQAFGSGLTYMRRYTLSAIAGVASEDDDDAEGATDREKKTTKKKEDW